MLEGKTIAVVVPCFNEETQILGVISTLPKYVDFIIAVDDKSTDKTLQILIKEKLRNDKLTVLPLDRNLGVGGAIDAGYHEALKLNSDVTAVMGGDGQMNPSELESLILSLLRNKVDYAKISRLYDEKYFNEIPKIRLIGNSILSILTRLSSGYWNMSDSQTGFTVISKDALSQIQGDLWPKYGFPNDVLNKLGLLNYRIVEVPSRPIYGVGEKSKLKPRKVAFPIFKLVIKGFIRRVKTHYFIRTFHPIGIGYALSILGILIGSIWLTKIFAYDYLHLHNTPPIQIICALIFTQTNFFILWLTLMFDALTNQGNCISQRISNK